MPKKTTFIPTHTHDKIKINAKLEKRSVTNYLECLIENLFIHNDFIKSNGILHIEPDSFSTIIKKDTILSEKNIDNTLDIDKDNINKIDNIDIKTNESDGNYDKNYNDNYDEYFEIEKIGIQLRLDNDAKPAHVKSSAYIFDEKLSDHERGWLYKNPTCTMEDYKKTFADTF
jgi:hypothetical protein